MEIVKHEKQSAPQRKAKLTGVSLWTRFSPLYIFRVFRDTYVRGCVTFGNSSKVTAVAHATAFQMSGDENTFNRSSSRCIRDDIASAQELLDLSAKFTREVLEQESVQSGRKNLSNGLTLADLQGYLSPARSPLRKPDRIASLKMEEMKSHSGPLRNTGASGLTLNDLQGHSGPLRARPSFDTALSSGDFNAALKIQDLFETSALHPTEFLQSSSSRRVAALNSPYHSPHPPRNSGFSMARANSERLAVRRLQSRYSSPSKPLIPLTPLTEMSSFREQNSRKSYDHPRASFRRRERYWSSSSTSASSRQVAPFDDMARSRSGISQNRPNPYRDYDTRLPSPALTV